MTWFQAVLIAIVEGITEFLPVSSTGHMIITQAILGVESTDFVKAFTVNIQFGAILSVIVLYWKRFFQSWNFYFRLFVACLPLAIAYVLEKQIDAMLGSVVIVASALLLGGIVLIFVDRWFPQNREEEAPLTYKKSFLIGLFQIISVIPGVSRSAATIVGGMTQKLSRRSAAEFSFFLAVPTMFAASALKLTENYKLITGDNLGLLILGNIVAFIVAMAAIKTFIAILTRYGFKWFGWYRIVVGLIILLLLFTGHSLTLS
ncbi:MAG TPA: undecaprenyl-diphosphate phosphatase [Bacteroidales bacterium]|nr:undecaprenyl-diphosphate phosphatase [Bacteroidales bacterium]HPS62657.1 undecaprenyl-diphosphate phosphatase [Bacteroidales bacterium]